MTEFIQGIAVIVLYRIVTIVCGLVIVYLGFVLFRLGVYEKAGELKAVWGTKNLTLKQAAPGTFFALFGACVIAVTVWRGLDFSSISGSNSTIVAASPSAPSASVTAGTLLGRKMPDSLKSALAGAALGQQLTEPERKALSEYLDLLKEIEKSIQYRAYEPPLKNSTPG